MTTLMYTDPATATETRVQAVARRLRMELARVGISPTAAARALGMSQPWLSRRVNGHVPLDIADLDRLSQLGVSYLYVVSGIRAIDPDGGDTIDLRIISNLPSIRAA